MRFPGVPYLVATVLLAAVAGVIARRYANERTALLRAATLTAAAGGAAALWAWVSAAEPDWVSDAAYALGIGGPVAFVALFGFGRRTTQHD